jgi:chromosome segregation ATPase
MSDKELVTELKHQIADLTQEKKDVIKLCEEKDSKIKQILIKLEQSNLDVHSMGKKIHTLEEKASKKATFKRIINEKIDEVLEKKDELDVDNED